METMMRDPEMQKMLYPYLPEPMRNPTSIEWMLSNPEVRKQMEDMFESQVRMGLDCFCIVMHEWIATFAKSILGP